MGVAKDVSSAAMPYILLAGVIGGIYLFRNQIVDWIKSHLPGGTPASEYSPTGTTDSYLEWLTSFKKDYGFGKDTPADAPLSGHLGQGILSAQLDDWFPGNPVSDFIDSVFGGVKDERQGVSVGDSQVTGGSSIPNLPGAPGSLTEANLELNRELFESLPTSYQQVKQFDIKPGRGFLDFDYVMGNEALQITEDSWHYLQYQKHSWGWEWTDIASSGGSSPAVWHNPQFVGYLEKFGVI